MSFLKIKTEISSKTLFIRLLLIALFIFSAIRLIGFVVKFGYESLQMDFSQFYTAGEALNCGLSPYQNHITHKPPIWDGRAVFKHSRFIYPPLVGVLFRPLTLLPYLYAKFIWMFFSISCIGFALEIVRRTLGLEDKLELSLVIGILLCLFYPLLTLLERGHLYSFTLLIMTIAIVLMQKGTKAKILSGILWAIAGLIQPYCLFIFPFLMLRRKWKAVTGFIIGAILIFLLTISVTGYKLLSDYIFNEMPRIAVFGELGTQEMLLSADIIQRYLTGIVSGMTMKDAIIYKPSYLNFVTNASLVRTSFGWGLSEILTKMKINVSDGILSIITLAGFFVFMLIWQLYHRRQFSHLTPMQEVIYWQIILIIILLSGQQTWVMNVVWILPTVIIILHCYRLVRSKLQAIYLFLCTIGLILAALPDHYAFLVPFDWKFLMHKYIIVEILLFFSLLFISVNINECS